MASPHNDPGSQPPMNATPKPKRWGWELYFGIAFMIAIWTALGALFFLAVVWVLRLNPGPETSFTLGRNDQKTARRIYAWLLLSSFLTVPIFISAAANTYYSSTINERVLTALIPLILHLPLLLGLTSKSGFVYRHTQQGILLIALRAGMASLAAMNVKNHIDYALLLFFFGNGTLWLFGSLMGWHQITNAKCWFMGRKGEKGVAQEPPTTQVKDEREQKLEQHFNSLNAKERQTAIEKSLEAFRSGIPGEVRKNAVKILSILGEVEKF